ncbi:MAG: DUF4062 domain-containing protein [Gammaproteobacteria bacterium]
MATSRPERRPVHVFIASPGDLAVERRAFKDVIDDLNAAFGDDAGVRFVALGWEGTLAATGRRAQGVINQEIDRSDVFVLALHRRWGQEAPDAKPHSSYTEEEFHRAMDRWTKLQTRRSRLDGRCRPSAPEGPGLPLVPRRYPAGALSLVRRRQGVQG